MRQEMGSIFVSVAARGWRSGEGSGYEMERDSHSGYSMAWDAAAEGGGGVDRDW
jgi:hypothetical protein